jgi:hypothetical protein
MRNKLLLSILSFGLAAMTIPACGSSSSDDGPEITQVEVPAGPVEPNADTSYTVDLTVTFDDDVDVDTYNFDSAAANISVMGTIDPAAPAGDLTIEVDLPTGTDSGTVDFDITVTDVNGLTSNDATGVVILDQ